MKLIIRADDVGYTVPNNQGIFKAIDQGIVTSADLMLDCPGFENAVEFLKERPWISVGWHPHFWGAPVLPADKVPSMVNSQGRFKFRRDQSLKDTCEPEEIRAECRAQVERCIRLLGRGPDYTHSHKTDSLFEKVRLEVCDEYGIKYGFATKLRPDGSCLEVASEQYAALGIEMPDQPGTVYRASFDDSMKVRKTYDPVKYFLDDSEGMLSKKVFITAWHPGYLDDYILKESTCLEARVVDLIALCSDELKQWIRDNQVELVNYRDALYGSREYQNHLKVTGSNLFIPAGKQPR